eukprot:290094_1
MFSKYVQSGFQAIGTGLGLVISQALVELHQKGTKEISGIQVVSPVQQDSEYWTDLKKKEGYFIQMQNEKKQVEPWEASTLGEFQEAQVGVKEAEIALTD